jgi:hypothetical protein
MAKRPTTETRVLEARAAAAEAGGKVRELEAKRAERLLLDDDDGASKLWAEIGRLRLFVSNTEEKAALLQKELQKETAQRFARENEAKIGRIEQKLQAREAIAAELETVFARANELILEMLAIGRQVDAAWGWAGGDRHALLLFRGEVVGHLAFEMYRLSAIPRLGGGRQEGVDAGWHLPGAKAPLELVHLPKKIPSFVSVLQNATSYASDVMRARRTPASNDAPVVPVVAPEPRERTVAEVELAGLLQRQHELAAIANPTPDDDRAYAELVQQISLAQASIGEQANA